MDYEEKKWFSTKLFVILNKIDSIIVGTEK